MPPRAAVLGAANGEERQQQLLKSEPLRGSDYFGVSSRRLNTTKASANFILGSLLGVTKF